MKIVVLDDSKSVLFMIQILLEEAGAKEGWIHLFSEGKEALSFIESNSADLIFSDIQMPGMDGFEFAKKVLEISESYRSVLYVVSADEDSDERERMKTIGIRNFILKPIESQGFIALLAPVIAERATATAPLTEEMGELLRGEDFSHLEYEDLARQIGIHRKHLPRLVESFVTESMRQLERLKEAFAAKNYLEMEHCAHAIKGSAGNMHLNSLYELARSAERAAHAADETFPYDACRKTLKKSIMTLPRSS